MSFTDAIAGTEEPRSLENYRKTKISFICCKEQFRFYALNNLRCVLT